MTSSSVLSLEEAEESLIESPVHPPVPGLRRWSLVFSVSLLPPAVATIGLCVLVVTFVITSQRECLPPGRTLPLISDTAAPHPQYWIFLAGMVTISALLLPTLLCKFAVRLFSPAAAGVTDVLTRRVMPFSCFETMSQATAAPLPTIIATTT